MIAAAMVYCWAMGQIKMVCFDWGGVILRICRSWTEGCAAAGLPVRGPSATPEWAAKRRPLSREFEVGKLSEAEYFQRMAESMERLYTAEEVERVHAAWLVREYDGVDSIVDRLNALAHIETGLLSNTNPHHWARQSPHPSGLSHFPTAGRLRHKFASHLMGHAKPDARIYEAFALAVGRTPAEILFFDDLPDNIATAKSCGWIAEQIDHTGDTASQIEAHLRAHGIF